MNSRVRHPPAACLQPIGAWHPDGNAARIAVTSNGTQRVATPAIEPAQVFGAAAWEFLVAALPAADPRIMPTMNAFTAASYKQLTGGDGNLILSPFNIATALSMALA